MNDIVEELTVNKVLIVWKRGHFFNLIILLNHAYIVMRGGKKDGLRYQVKSFKSG